MNKYRKIEDGVCIYVVIFGDVAKLAIRSRAITQKYKQLMSTNILNFGTSKSKTIDILSVDQL